MNQINNEIKQLIKKYFSKYKLIQNPAIKIFFKNNKQIQINCLEILSKYPEYENMVNLIKSIVFDIPLKYCKTCNKLLKFSQNLYCSRKCAISNHQEIMQRKETCKQTCLKRYGKQNISQVQSIQNKRIKTCQQKYGGNAPICSTEVKTKFKSTMKEKYGVEYSIYSQEIRLKQQQTCLKKYKNRYAIASDIVKNQIKHTFKTKYNINFVGEDKNIQEKIQNTCIKKYGFKTFSLYHSWNNILTWKDYIIPLFEKSEYSGLDKIYKWKCVKCGNEFKQRIYTTHFHEKYGALPRCLKCYPKKGGTSNAEK